MKGVKKCIGLAILFIICLLSLKTSSNASAATINTNSVNYNYQSTPSSDYIWSSAKSLANSDGLCGSDCYLKPIWHARYLQFNFANTAFQGNHGTLHFEANVVYDDTSQLSPSWINLDRMSITSCLVGSTPLNIESQTLSYAQTPWSWNSSYQKYDRNTLTIYADIVMSGIPSGSGSISCNFGSSNFAYFEGGSYVNNIIYVERNPASLVFSNNLNDALLQQQIAQNEVMIQNQQAMINAIDNLSLAQQEQNEKDDQDREDIQNASDDGQEAAEQAGQAIDNASASLLTIIGNFVNIIISPPASDCSIDADMGHMDLGTIDLCQLSPPPAFGTIATILVIGFTIPFAYSLIMTFLSMLKGATQD